ncbi:hypothetical protein C8Q74DRAFT_238375 [Fomes fomentarius]|nr:hypothetical protein C8Q74DRAFT_238375 [Fomes fomentarius]
MFLVTRSSEGGTTAGRPGGSRTSGGSGHHESSTIPAVTVIVILIFSILLARYIITRIRRSGRRVLSFGSPSIPQPKMSDMFLGRPMSSDARWDRLCPVAVEVTDLQCWPYPEHFGIGDAMHGAPVGRLKRSRDQQVYHRHRSHIADSRERAGGSPGEAVELRVTVIVAMPGQYSRDSRRLAQSEAGIGISSELCIGTVHASC